LPNLDTTHHVHMFVLLLPIPAAEPRSAVLFPLTLALPYFCRNLLYRQFPQALSFGLHLQIDHALLASLPLALFLFLLFVASCVITVCCALSHHPSFSLTHALFLFLLFVASCVITVFVVLFHTTCLFFLTLALFLFLLFVASCVITVFVALCLTTCLFSLTLALLLLLFVASGVILVYCSLSNCFCYHYQCALFLFFSP